MGTFLFAAVGAAILVAAAYVGIPHMLAGMLTRVPRVKIPKNPGDYGLNYKNIEFKASDGITLRGWHIPGKGDRVAVIVHVGNMTKYGLYVAGFPNKAMALYDRDIEYLKFAQGLNANGYDVILFDLRNFGDSDAANNGINTYGEEESKDIIACLNFIKNDPTLAGKKVGIVGFCYGGMTTTIAMGRDPKAFERVKAFVFVQPTDESVAKGMNPVIKMLFPRVKSAMRTRFNVDVGATQDNFEIYKKIVAPTLLVQSRYDQWVDLERIKRAYANIPEPKEILWLEGGTHRYDAYKYFEDHHDDVLKWFDRWM
jgi:pimeloyl-ACP methyl ester carboxylesterase